MVSDFHRCIPWLVSGVMELTSLADFGVVMDVCQILSQVVPFDGHDLVQNVNLEAQGTSVQVVTGRGEGLGSAYEEFLQIRNHLCHENVVRVVFGACFELRSLDAGKRPDNLSESVSVLR